MSFLNRKKNIWVVLGLLAAIALAIGFIPSGEEEHAHEFWWTGLRVFFAAFGFLGCIVLGLLAKKLLGRWLDRREDYYG